MEVRWIWYRYSPLSNCDNFNRKSNWWSISFYGGKTIHTFLNSGTFIAPGSFNETIQYVVIGGAGGNYDGGGGGGAGAWLEGTTPISSPQTITVTIGAGGNNGIQPGSPGQAPYTVGNPTSFGSPLTAPGGGGSSVNPRPGGPGGSGGGGRGGSAVGSGGGSTGDPFPGTPGTASPSNGYGHDGGAATSGHPGGGVVVLVEQELQGAPPDTRGHGGIGIQCIQTIAIQHPQWDSLDQVVVDTG